MKLERARAGLPQSQEKSGKPKKKDKSQEKIEAFEKNQEKSGNLTKLKKSQIFSV